MLTITVCEEATIKTLTEVLSVDISARAFSISMWRIGENDTAAKK
jgi:hypothetical protein